MAGEVTATVEGRSHVIPDIWLAGFCTNNGCSVEQAILWWDWQQRIEEAGEWIEAPAAVAALGL